MIHCKKIYGLTGGIASGKSTVSNVLIRKDIQVVDMDKISREIFEIGKPAYIEVVDNFGQYILDHNRKIDRTKLRDIVFSDKEKLEILNNITHPAIMQESKEKIDNILKIENVVFVDIPLLFETIEKLKEHGIIFDKIVLVYVNRETQTKRLMIRDDMSREDAIKIIESQMDIEKKKDMADIVIDNSGDLEDLKIKLEEFFATEMI